MSYIFVNEFSPVSLTLVKSLHFSENPATTVPCAFLYDLGENKHFNIQNLNHHLA